MVTEGPALYYCASVRAQTVPFASDLLERADFTGEPILGKSDSSCVLPQGDRRARNCLSQLSQKLAMLGSRQTEVGEMRLVRTVLSWALALFLIAVFVQSTIHPLSDPPEGSVKFFDKPGENIIFQTLATNSGYTIFEPTGRFVVGIVELIAALLLLLPFTRRSGAVLSFLILAGAVSLHLSPWLGMEVPTSLEPGAATDGGGLFSLAVASLVASLLIIFLHPGRKSA